MKKLYILLFLAGLSIFSFGQTYLLEDFSSGQMPPADWSIDAQAAQWSINSGNNAGGVAPEAKFHYATGVATSRLISPEIDLTGLDAISFQFTHFLDDYSGTGYTLGVATRSGSGDWNIVWDVAPTGDMGPETVSFEITDGDVGASDFQVCIYFDGNMYNLDDWYIDDIWLFLPLNLDAGMQQISTPNYLGGLTPVEGTIKNFGSSEITSSEISWQIDEGDITTTSFDGFNISFGETYSFTCDGILDLPIGSYNLSVWIETVNGVADDDNSNDVLAKMVSVVSHTIVKTPCLEEFTSSTCAPCASFHTTFVPWCEQHDDEMTLVKYQMSWPGSGDPYYTEEGGERRNYYGVTWVPWLVGDGQFANTTTAAAQAVLDAAAETAGLLDIASSFTLDGTEMTINTNVLPFASFSNFRVHMVVFEYLTTENVATNGETEFEHVMMKMVPDANGTTVDLTDRIPHTITETVDLAGTNVEEWDDLGVVIIVQDFASTDVFQSEYSLEDATYATDASLTSISVDGEPIPDFSPDVFEYTVYTWAGNTEAPLVEASATDPNATTIVVPATELPGSTTVDVFAEDLATYNTYTVNFDYGTGEILNESNVVSIHPNPTTGKVYISGAENAEVMIYSVTGQLVASYNNFSSSAIDLSNLNEGIYIMNIVIDDKTVLNKKISLLK